VVEDVSDEDGTVAGVAGETMGAAGTGGATTCAWDEGASAANNALVERMVERCDLRLIRGVLLNRRVLPKFLCLRLLRWSTLSSVGE
jgi:hypothetical protein